MLCPLLAQNAHVHKVEVLPVAPNVLAQAAFFAEPAGTVSADGARAPNCLPLFSDASRACYTSWKELGQPFDYAQDKPCEGSE